MRMNSACHAYSVCINNERNMAKTKCERTEQDSNKSMRIDIVGLNVSYETWESAFIVCM